MKTILLGYKNKSVYRVAKTAKHYHFFSQILCFYKISFVAEHSLYIYKRKVIPLQALCDPEGG